MKMTDDIVARRLRRRRASWAVTGIAAVTFGGAGTLVASSAHAQYHLVNIKAFYLNETEAQTAAQNPPVGVWEDVKRKCGQAGLWGQPAILNFGVSRVNNGWMAETNFECAP